MSARAITSSAITYKGQIIPVKIYTLVESDTSPLSNACSDCNGDIGHKNFCKSCEKESPSMNKAYRINKTEKVVLTEEQLTKLKEVDGEIAVLGTVPKSEFDLKLVSGSYYLKPDMPKKKVGKSYLKAYGILRSGVAESNDFVVVRFSVRTKERIGVLTVQDNVLVLLAVAYQDQVREIEFDEEIDLSDEEVKIGKKFVSQLDKTDLSQIPNRFKDLLEDILSGSDSTTVEESKKDDEDEMGFFK